MDDKTRIESARRGQYVLTLATVDGVLVDRWEVHDGMFGPGDETSTDLSEGRRLGKQVLMQGILDAIVGFNEQVAKGTPEERR